VYHFIPMGEIQIQALTHGYHDCQVPDEVQYVISKYVQDMENVKKDVFQNVMSKHVQDMEYVKTYLDDLLILTN
jgi:hypothetical protein